jgi:DNA invertase Pin-like site-specific DNA recombinase
MPQVRVAIYVRSSLDCSLSADEQIDRLKTVATERGWMVTRVFADRPTSTKCSLDRRPGELALIDAIRSSTIEKVLVWSVCRLGKTLIDLICHIDDCRVAGVSLYLHEQKVDSAETNGLTIADVAAMLAFHLHQTRRDRILRGQAAARALSIRFGRPPIPTAKIEKARRELAAGKGVRQVARLAGISAASVTRLKHSINSATANI